jgi:aminoglycoside phosphotransferase (APT) family kinase protein
VAGFAGSGWCAVNAPESGVDRELVLVVHPDRPMVLAGGQDGGGLVEVSVDDPPAGWPDLLAAARLAVPDGAWPLGPDRRVPGTCLHVVQARTAAVSPGYRWVDVPDPLLAEPVRRAVCTVVEEDAGRIPIHPLRPPWMRRDWWTTASAWVDARLAEAGRQRTGELEPKEHWGVSAVARVPATGGAIWLKAAPPLFAREPGVLAVLAERVGNRVPRVLAVDTSGADSFFLMEDAGAVPDEVDHADPPRLAALIADLQVRTLDLLPELAAAGCVDRAPARLVAELARMAEDGMELDLLEPSELVALRRSLPQISDRLLALADGPLPTVLVHGDFHAWNVVRAAGWTVEDAVVIDWTDAAIGPAGVDLATLLPASADPAARARVRSGYAAVWAAHLGVPVQEVEAAVAAAVPAARVVQALAYDEILRALEPAARSPLSGVMATYLRALLTAPSVPC